MKRSEWRKKTGWLKLTVYVLTFLVSLIYIVYRIGFTLPLGLRAVDILLAFVVLAIELVEFFEFGIYFWNNLRFEKKSRKTPEVEELKLGEVDVFIATLNEDEDVLRSTLKACAVMDYPKEVHLYLCDDGERAELAELADEFGAEYLARKKHEFAKAGNYNYALRRSSSPYIAIFDADMRPDKDFLMRTMPFFAENDKLGFVQTPQCFRNPDIFQARFSKKMPCEQDYFYRYIQLARNNVQSTIMCGTNCVLSRAALKSVGGFAQATIAEDVATGMLMEAKGYGAIAIKDSLVYGEAIEDFGAFLRQRSRWGRGCIQTGKSYGIFSVKGLNLRQKLDYFTAIHYWCFGLRRVLYMALPLIFIFFNVIAIEANLQVFVPLFLAQYCLKRFVIDSLEESGRSATWAKIYELIQAPYLAWVVLKELLGFSNKKFAVTPKGEKGGKKGADYAMLFAHWILFLANGLGLAVAIFKSRMEGVVIYLIPLVWAAINLCYLCAVLIFDLRISRSDNFKVGEKKRYGVGSFLSIIWREK